MQCQVYAADVCRLEGHTTKVAAVCSIGRRLCTAGRDSTIRVWDQPSGLPLATLLGHRGWVNALCVDGIHLWSGGRDGTVRLWDVEFGTELAMVAVRGVEASDRAVTALMAVGSNLYVGHWGGFVSLLDLETRIWVCELRGHKGWGLWQEGFDTCCVCSLPSTLSSMLALSAGNPPRTERSRLRRGLLHSHRQRRPRHQGLDADRGKCRHHVRSSRRGHGLVCS